MNASNVTSIVAVVISISAFIVSCMQLDIANDQLERQRQHDRLSVKPNIKVYATAENVQNHFGVYITNEGLGPAVLKDVVIFDPVENHSLMSPNTWPVIFRKMGLESGCFKKGHPRKDYVIRAAAEYPIVAASSSMSPDCIRTVAEFLVKNKLRISVTYESMYGEQFRFTGPMIVEDPEFEAVISRLPSK